MCCMVQDAVSSINGKTAPLQITESLAPTKLSHVQDLSFAVIVTTLCTKWAYESAVSLALGD